MTVQTDVYGALSQYFSEQGYIVGSSQYGLSILGSFRKAAWWFKHDIEITFRGRYLKAKVRVLYFDPNDYSIKRVTELDIYRPDSIQYLEQWIKRVEEEV